MKKCSSLLDIANELFKDSRPMAPEESKVVSDYFRENSKTLRVVRVKDKKRKKISFDFDGTLEYEEVQEFAKELIKRGYKVCILTTRYSDPSKYHSDVTGAHQQLFDVAKDVGIEEIYFTEFEWKYKVIDKYGIDVHLDDDYWDEVYVINKRCKAKAVLFSCCWRTEFEKVLNKLEKECNIGGIEE